MASYAYTFNSGDGVTPTRLNAARTVSDIVNADIKSDAAIAGTKIAPAFGAQDITVSTANRSITNTGNFALSFGTNNTERMRIDASGNVGIGTSSPTFKLVAAGGAQDGGWIGAASTTSTLGLGDYSNGGLATFQIAYSRSSGVATFSNGGRDTPTERMRIDANGNVGIGAAPSHLLDVAGTVNTSDAYRVDGSKVVGNRATGWAAATGTATRTTFATSTVTTAQLAERVKALIDDLTTHGLIGA